MTYSASVRSLIRLALREDLNRAGDVTTRAFIPSSARISGDIVAKQDGVVCGMEIVRAVFRTVSPRIRFKALVRDGRKVRKGQAVARVSGPREILTAERTALNFLQHLSGVATLTRRYADRLRGTRARLYDTRKTLPGWRALEKYAVLRGGGSNHRMGLYDAVMLKDNHLDSAARLPGADGMSSQNILEGIRRAKGRGGARIPIIMEAKSSDQIRRALECRADIVLLDNMSLPRLRRAIASIRSESPKTQIEVSGGVRLENIRAVARLGPDRISVGRITHSAPALDFSLECHAKN